MECNPTNVVTPTNSNPVPCNGDFKSTDCILAENAISYLTIEEGESMTSVLGKIALAFQAMQQQIDELTERVEELENPV